MRFVHLLFALVFTLLQGGGRVALGVIDCQAHQHQHSQHHSHHTHSSAPTPCTCIDVCHGSNVATPSGFNTTTMVADAPVAKTVAACPATHIRARAVTDHILPLPNAPPAVA
jgi:hypothetical protein